MPRMQFSNFEPIGKFVFATDANREAYVAKRQSVLVCRDEF
jgi:hypothetical protein